MKVVSRSKAFRLRLIDWNMRIAHDKRARWIAYRVLKFPVFNFAPVPDYIFFHSGAGDFVVPGVPKVFAIGRNPIQARRRLRKYLLENGELKDFLA